MTEATPTDIAALERVTDAMNYHAVYDGVAVSMVRPSDLAVLLNSRSPRRDEPTTLGGKVNAFEALLKSLSPAASSSIAKVLHEQFPWIEPKATKTWVPPTPRRDVAGVDQLLSALKPFADEFIARKQGPRTTTDDDIIYGALVITRRDLRRAHEVFAAFPQLSPPQAESLHERKNAFILMIVECWPEAPPSVVDWVADACIGIVLPASSAPVEPTTDALTKHAETVRWAFSTVTDDHNKDPLTNALANALLDYDTALAETLSTLRASRLTGKSSAVAEIEVERERQKSVEGWTIEHDDEHCFGELAKAAGWYALNAAFIGRRECLGDVNNPRHEAYSLFAGDTASKWPWDLSWWKPKNARRDLVRAGALIVAEIERLDRALPTPPASEGDRS